MRTEYVGRRLTRGEAHVPHQCHQRICMGIACRQRRSSSPRPSDLAPGRCNREAGGGRAADRAAAAGWQRQGGSGRAAMFVCCRQYQPGSVDRRAVGCVTEVKAVLQCSQQHGLSHQQVPLLGRLSARSCISVQISSLPPVCCPLCGAQLPSQSSPPPPTHTRLTQAIASAHIRRVRVTGVRRAGSSC